MTVPRRPVLFINPASGGGTARRVKLDEHARAAGIATVVLEPGADLASLVDEAIADGADALGMAGGDGSMAVVAAAASAAGLPFVLVPAGTRNHFARDLGIAPQDPVGALAAFTGGVERRVDLGEVNGHVFVNNVSVGVYGDAVQRDGYRDAKLRTLLETARGRPHDDPAALLVSNNPYVLGRPLASGARRRLDTGQLGILVLGRPADPPHRAVRAWTASSLELTAAAELHAGRDGEAVTLESPLRFASRPGALRVRTITRTA